MCGIAGIVGLDSIDQPESIGKRMTDTMAHRGPNAEGVFVEGDVMLAHRRLSIIDLSKESDQPFHSSDGRYVIVYNGEIYNYRELRDEFRDREFRTASDTEVLLAAYERWGVSCLDRLDGMFAFAIWDKRDRTGIIARDRLGIKPLYYHQGQERLVFASELRTLLASDLVPRKLDHASLGDYVRFQTVHAPATIVKDVKMLMPGHFMEIGKGISEPKCWWHLVDRIEEQPIGQDASTAQKEIRERLSKAVEKRLVSDVPFGAFLSGGIDSSAVVGLMSEVSNGPVHTFSVGFDEEEFSEEKWAKIVADKFNTEHTPIRLKATDFLDPLPEILAAMDHPSSDGPNTYVVSRATKEAGVTMALSGLGGDEVFAGYPIFERSIKLNKMRLLAAAPGSLRRVGASLVSRTKFPRNYHKIAGVLQSGTVEVRDTYPISRQIAHEQEIRSMLGDTATLQDRVRDIAVHLLSSEKGKRLPVLSQVSVLELSTYLQNVLLRDTDQMSMAHALEVRVPFLDHELVQYVLGVSDKLKYPHTPKELLTNALGDLLPREIIDRPKMGFTLPWANWMRTELRSFCKENMTALAERPEVDRTGVLDLWDRFSKNDPRVSWARIWYLVVLQDWLKRNEVA